MANRDFNLPIKGFSEIVPPDKQSLLTTGYINNIYPLGALDNKIRLVQRPGLGNIYSEQIGGVSVPIVAICSITTVD